MRRRRRQLHTRNPNAPTFAKQRFIARKIRLLRAEGYPQKQAEAIAYRYAGEAKKTRRVSRDPSEDAKLRAKRVAIERSIRKLADSALSRSDGFAVQQKIQRAIEKYELLGRQLGDGQAHEIGRRLWREVVDAKERAGDNYSASLRTQLSEATFAARAARPVPGSYEHELAMHGVRGRR